MQKLLRKSFFSKAALLIFSVASFSLTGCLDNNSDLPEPAPATYISFYQGSPDAPDLDIQLNSKPINKQPFKYSNSYPYVGITPGTHNIKFTSVNASTAHAEAARNFKEGKLYSVFAINKLEDMEILVTLDSAKAPGSGKALLRVVHISPDAPAVDVNITGTNGTLVASDLAFKEVTPFIEVTGGSQNIEVKSTDSDEVLLSVSNNKFVAGGAYTLIIRGFATPPTGNTNALAAQILENQ